MSARKNKLEAWKDQHGYSWRRLEREIGISRAALIAIARGRVSYVKPDTVKKIAEITGLTHDDIIAH